MLAVLVLQFVLRQPDRQAAEAVPYDLRWRLALHLTPADATFDPSVLVVFRNRLVEHETEGLAFAAVLGVVSISRGRLYRNGANAFLRSDWPDSKEGQDADSRVGFSPEIILQVKALVCQSRGRAADRLSRKVRCSTAL